MGESRVATTLSRTLGWDITTSDLPITLENVHSDYRDEDSTIAFRISNGGRLYLHFPRDGGGYLIAVQDDKPVRTPSQFKSRFPIGIGVVPVLGPVEHEERIVTEETVRIGLPTHRASRHFRNYCRQNPNDFEEFADLIAQTWPGMTIEFPEIVDLMDQKLAISGRNLRSEARRAIPVLWWDESEARAVRR